jgi:uncharacterized RDD family membrane protein YckC
VARVVDILVVLVLCVIANAWFGFQFWKLIGPYLDQYSAWMASGQGTDQIPAPPESIDTLILLMCVVIAAVWFAYEVPSSANSGQTLGKRLLGIKVVRLDSDAERLGFGRSLRRWGRLGLPTLLWSCFGIGFLFQLIDCVFVLFDKPLRQALHDKSAATAVVYVPRASWPESARTLDDATAGGRHVDAR